MTEATSPTREQWEREADAMLAEAMRPTVGKTIEVVKGRKIPHGVRTKVIWYGETNYHRGRYVERSMRVAITGPDGRRVFTSADNVRVVNPEDYWTAPHAITYGHGPHDVACLCGWWADAPSAVMLHHYVDHHLGETHACCELECCERS